MLKYFIIQLDDSASSFCHYPDSTRPIRLISIDKLEDAVKWSMKENLNVQFIYPDYQLPNEYKELIESVYHANIVSSKCKDAELLDNADVVVFKSLDGMCSFSFKHEQAYVIRTGFNDFLNNHGVLLDIFPKIDRLSIVFTDIASFSESNEAAYKDCLDSWSAKIVEEYAAHHPIQINILTDRLLLDKMNNCNAGDESITLAPDGKFYVCPAFYFDGSGAVGDLINGLNVKNPQLYRLAHAPICRTCDAFQCKRCVWLNRNMTLEVNTPSHEQCVIAHIERNASRKLLQEIRKIGEFLPEKEIKEIDYLDPYENVKN